MSWIWLAPVRYDRQKEGQKVNSLASRLLNARKGINWWAALTAPRKRIPPQHPALLWPSRTAKAKCSSCLGSRTASPWAGSMHLCSCFPIWVWSSIKSELACALYYIRGKTLQKQNRRLPSQPLEKLRKFAEKISRAASLPATKLTSKIMSPGTENPSKTGSALLRKFLFREGFLLIPASNVLAMPTRMSTAEWDARIFYAILLNGNG